MADVQNMDGPITPANSAFMTGKEVGAPTPPLGVMAMQQPAAPQVAVIANGGSATAEKKWTHKKRCWVLAAVVVVLLVAMLGLNMASYRLLQQVKVHHEGHGFHYLTNTDGARVHIEQNVVSIRTFHPGDGLNVLDNVDHPLHKMALQQDGDEDVMLATLRRENIDGLGNECPAGGVQHGLTTSALDDMGNPRTDKDISVGLTVDTCERGQGSTIAVRVSSQQEGMTTFGPINFPKGTGAMMNCDEGGDCVVMVQSAQVFGHLNAMRVQRFLNRLGCGLNSTAPRCSKAM